MVKIDIATFKRTCVHELHLGRIGGIVWGEFEVKVEEAVLIGRLRRPDDKSVHDEDVGLVGNDEDAVNRVFKTGKGVRKRRGRKGKTTFEQKAGIPVNSLQADLRRGRVVPVCIYGCKNQGRKRPKRERIGRKRGNLSQDPSQSGEGEGWNCHQSWSTWM